MSGGSGNSNIPRGPQIITERRLSLTSRKEKERKRRSLPSSTGPPYNDPRRRYANRVTIEPASPEVISSLIDTLSAISSPVEHRADDSLPNIIESHFPPVSPSARDTRFPRAGSSIRAPPSPLANSFGVSKGSLAPPSVSHSQGGRRAPGLSIEPPARRSSKSATNRSSKYKSGEAAYEDLLDDAYSIGTPSIERGKGLEPSPKQASHRRSIKSIRSARSGKSLRSLAMKNSTDSLRNSDVPVFITKKEPEPKRERLFITDAHAGTPRSPDPNLNDHGMPMGAFDLLTTNEGHSTKNPSSARRLYLDSEMSSPAGPSHSRKSSKSMPHQDLIPTRDSSRRHSAALSSRKRRSNYSHSERGVAHDSGTEAGDDDFHTPPQSPPATIAEFDEDSVNRRIEELKEQKTQRERLSLQQAPESLTIPEAKSRSPSRSPIPRTRTPDLQSLKAAGTKTPNGQADGTQATAGSEVNQETAPSPAVRVAPPKTDKATESVMSSLKPKSTKPTPHASKDGIGSVSVPQRSNSKLFKRGGRPTSPTSAEKSHRRRFSIGYMPSPQPTPVQQDDGDSIHDAVEEYLSSPRLSQQVANPQTGRVVCFSEVGDPEGSVVFCCVGMGLTRYISCFYDELATTLKLKLITPDRPGVGGSEPHADENDTPLLWPDDVRTICEHRHITKFSILAHSAGAIYALATALRMPQHIRCRVHLLAPWIPPSQMSTIGTQREPLPNTAMPYSQRFLRSLPTTFFRVANSSYLGVTSSSITTSLPRGPKKAWKKSVARAPTPTPCEILMDSNGYQAENTPSPKAQPTNQQPTQLNGVDKENRPPLVTSITTPLIIQNSKPPATSRSTPVPETSIPPNPPSAEDKATRRTQYETHLASRIWYLATTNANPAIDLLVCLERRQPIGFRYADITRPVVIHHGVKDSRVPVENVRWLGKTMRRCEVRVLEGEGHGLMANAAVMGGVLMEMAGEWEDWNRLVGVGKR